MDKTVVFPGCIPEIKAMSLKSKIEAVIYAAEEPVTLSQLVAIFALEVPAPESPAEDEPKAEQLEAPLAHADGEPEVVVLDEFGTMTDSSPTSEAGETPGMDITPLVAGELQGEEAEAPGPQAIDLDAAEKRAAKQRDREIRDHIREVVDELISDYALQERGIEIREIAGGFRMATKPEFHDAVRAFVKSLKPPMKLSLQALETLAVIAYKQPVTAPEVGEIRGVDSGGVLAGLISRKLVTTAGRKQVIGRPILYKTTKEFLMRFGLKDVAELPSMEEFEKMAGELAESDALEASAMHEKAGIHLVSDESNLPFEESSADENIAAEPQHGVPHSGEARVGFEDDSPEAAQTEHAEVPQEQES
jgi:segregation and condensation protein B